MQKRSGKYNVRLVPKLSSYHSELQKRVAIIGVSLIVVLILVGLGLYVAPGKFVGKVGEGSVVLYASGSSSVHAELGAAEGSENGRENIDVEAGFDELVTTDLWRTLSGDVGGWVVSPLAGYCQSGTNFCLGNYAPPNFDTENYYCYSPGSIVYTNHTRYCAQSYQGREYVWVVCGPSTQYTLTEDSTFICDLPTADGQHEWLQCTEEGEVRGEYRCNGNTWEECGDGSDYLCADSESEQCNEDTKFDVNQVGTDGQFYCSYTSGTNYNWVECTAETAGEGVYSADNHARYGDNYVCDGNSWEPILNCAACAGDLAGSCVGSSTVNFRTDEDLGSSYRYYTSSQIVDRIGCAAINECYNKRQEYAIDEKVTGTQTICGAENTFLRCRDGAVGVPSDGGAWLCKVNPDEDEVGNGIWDRCTEGDAGVQIDNFICSFNAAENKWQWFSEFSCSPSQRYQVRDERRICDGTSWITPSCAELETDNPFTDPNVQVTCDADNDLLVNELICNNNEDDDNDGRVDCDDQTQCSNNILYILNENNLYEITQKKSDCFTANIDIDSVDPVNYNSLNVCDLGTEAFGNRVTLCENRSGTNTPFLTLDSTALLANRFGQPHNDTNDLAFLFKEGTTKMVSVMLNRDISTVPLELPLATFAPNIAAGQRVMLGVNGESYILWHPAVTANVSFSEANLRLTHIATNTIIPALVYPGTNRYTFDLVGDRLMTFLIDTPLVDPDNQIFRIEALAPGEAPQSFPVPTNLEERFEVTFSKANPVRFIVPAQLGTFSVCRDDNAADPQQVKVCQKDSDNEESYFTLRARTLTERTLGDHNYAFLFEVVDNTKQVSIFTLESLSQAETPLNYDAFINSLVAGRRIALKFENTLFLLRHPVQPFISLPSITLTRYIGDVATTFPAIGSQDLIDFLASEGKINIHRMYGDPPPPFRISALRIEEIAPVSLDRDLSTSMSSLVPVTVNNELVRADDAQYESDENVFKIKIATTNLLLRLHQPSVQSDALYYYRSVSPSGSQLVKQVSIYRLYDLSTATQSHSYDEEFRQALASGKEFAITLDDGETYYLVGYENNNNEVLSFNINRLRLYTMDKTSTIPAVPDTGGVRFDLPDGNRVRFVVNYEEGILEMQTGLELLTEIPFTNYMTEINPSNEVKINRTANFRMCYLTAYAMLPGARVCDTLIGTVNSIDTGASDVDALANPLTIVPGSESYVLEVNGLMGNDKKVFVRNLTAIPISPAKYDVEDWFNFVGEIVAHREPYFQVNDRLYVPQTVDGRLVSFRLKQYPDGTPQAPRNVLAKTPLTANGSIVMNDRVIVIDQKETTSEERPVEASFRLQPYYYLPDNNDLIRFNTTAINLRGVTFVLAVDGTQYTLGTAAPITSLVRLSLATTQDPTNPLLNRFFAAEETRVLHLGTVQVEIKVESIFNNEAQITVKRR